MKTNKILLNDGSCLTDLIIFENTIEDTEIRKIIINVQKTKKDYTNEDIYFEIDKKFPILQIIDLNSINEFYY